MMQFVTLEYDDEFMIGKQKCCPMPPQFIRSFTVKRKLKAVIEKDLAYLNHCTVTATPDEKIFVESTMYPDCILSQLVPYTNELSQDVHVTTLELSRKKTVQSMAKNSMLPSPQDVLEALHVTVPKNVAIEISEWTAHANKLVVYENVVLLEIDSKETEVRRRILSEYSEYVVDQHSANFLLMTHGEKVFSLLEEGAYCPEKICHKAEEICVDRIRCISHHTMHRKKSSKQEKKKDTVVLNKSAFIALRSENVEFISKLKKALQKEGITPIVSDEKKQMCLVPFEASSQLSIVLKSFGKEFEIECVSNRGL
jgi:hypothetical protein